MLSAPTNWLAIQGLQKNDGRRDSGTLGPYPRLPPALSPHSLFSNIRSNKLFIIINNKMHIIYNVKNYTHKINCKVKRDSGPRSKLLFMIFIYINQ